MPEVIDLFAVDLDQPTEVLARWWNEFNVWDWPPELAHLKPARLDRHEHKDVIWPLMRAIEERITLKEVLRWHHLHNLGRSNAEFEAWWPRNCWRRDV